MYKENNIARLRKNTGKLKVAFVCVHNSCRSQIAECLGKMLASDIFDSYSAGTEVKDNINQDAVRLMKKIYDVNMEKTQRCKLLSDIPKPDVVILMGCNVNCPVFPSQYSENWELDDPSGKSDEEFNSVIEKIEKNILRLKERLLALDLTIHHSNMNSCRYCTAAKGECNC